MLQGAYSFNVFDRKDILQSKMNWEGTEQNIEASRGQKYPKKGKTFKKQSSTFQVVS